MLREFLSWNEPFLPQAAARLIDHHADAALGVARLERAWVVLPGGRAGRRLKELLVDAADQRGLRLVPPTIMTVGVLGHRLAPFQHPVASGLERVLAWSHALHAQPHELMQKLFTRVPEAGRPAAWTALARELDGVSRTVAAGGLRFSDIADRLHADGHRSEAARWARLARIQQAYEDALAQPSSTAAARCDADLERIAAASPLRPPADSIWLLGLAELNAVTRRQLAALDEWVALHALVHAPSDRADDFDRFGCIRAERWATAQLDVPDEQIHFAETPDEQARLAAEWLAALDGRYTPEEILIGTPDADVVPFIESQLERAGVPTRDAAGSSLRDTGPVRLLAAIAEVLSSGRSYESIAALVRHPDVERWIDAPDDMLTALDHWTLEHVPARMVAPYLGTSNEAERVRWVMDRLDRNLLSTWAGEQPLEAWAGVVRTVLLEVYGKHEADPASPASRRLGRIFEAIEYGLRTLETVSDALAPSCTGLEALRLLLEDCTSTRLPARADERAIELLGWLELHLDDAPATLITGVNEGTLPESIRGDLFLPDSLRSRLGLEDNTQRYARDLYRLTAILHSRRALALITGRRRASGDPLRPSRLLFASAPERVVHRVTQMQGNSQVDVPHRADPPSASKPAPASRFVLPPQPELRHAPSSLSVTDFRGLLDDPYTWAITRHLKLEPLRDDAMELDAARFGSLAHTVLERFGRREAERHAHGHVETDPKRICTELDEALERVVQGRFTRSTRIGVALQVEQLRGRLHALADWHADWVAQGWRVQAVEVATPMGGIPLPLDEGRSMGLRARIDRVDVHSAEGRWAVWDYKTSETGTTPDAAHRRGRGPSARWVDLQLPLYRWLVMQGMSGLAAPPTGTEITVGFIALPRALDGVGGTHATWTQPEFDDALEVARDVARTLLDEPLLFNPDHRPSFTSDELGALLGHALLTDDPDDPGAYSSDGGSE